ncbi:MAG: hypothetical protein ABSG25_01500 [Bryobacteraceae bacterium]
MIKRIKDEHLIVEMANFRKGNFGLPVNVFANIGFQSKHAARIKVQNNYSDRLMPGTFFSIKLHNKEIIGNHNLIKEKDIKLINYWIDLNYDALMEFWDGYLTDEEFRRKLKSI